MKRVLVAYPHGEQFPVLLVDQIAMVSQPGSPPRRGMRVYGSLPSYLRLRELKELLLALPTPFDAAICEGETERPRRIRFRAKLGESIPFEGTELDSFLVESRTGITLELLVEGEQPHLGDDPADAMTA